MLRVGLTGGLGSGKSTVAQMLRERGADVIEADELGRELMEPGQKVFSEIVEHFGGGVVAEDGRLDRKKLAGMVFTSAGNRLQELNAIIHPAVIQAQFDWADAIFKQNPAAICVVESALIYEVARDARLRGESISALADWRHRFDCIVVVTAPEKLRIERYVGKTAASKAISAEEREKIISDAKARIAQQIPEAEKAARADFVVENSGDERALRETVEKLWEVLRHRATISPQPSL